MNFRRGTGRDEPEINLIPFIDVLLVIIIFLMMTTTYNKVAGIEIELPTANQSQVLPPDEINVMVATNGTVLIDGESLNHPDIETMATALKAVKAKRGESAKMPVVLISADAKATHQSVIDVMQAARQADLSQISFTTRQGS